MTKNDKNYEKVGQKFYKVATVLAGAFKAKSSIISANSAAKSNLYTNYEKVEQKIFCKKLPKFENLLK